MYYIILIFILLNKQKCSEKYIDKEFKIQNNIVDDFSETD